VGIATLVGVGEFCTMAFPNDPWDRGFGMASGALLLSAMLVPTQERFAMALAAVVVAGLVLALARKDDLRHGVDALGLTLLGSLYVAFLLPHYVWVHAMPDPRDRGRDGGRRRRVFRRPLVWPAQAHAICQPREDRRG
jgi:hypothetical protein